MIDGIYNCVECGCREIHNKKRGLCRKCYDIMYRDGSLKDDGKILERQLYHFKESLIKRYGEEIIFDLKRLKSNPFLKLKDVGEKHGVTREYIRQVYNKFYNTKYGNDAETNISKIRTSCVHDIRNKYLNNKRGNTSVWKGTKIEYKFYKKCIDYGLPVAFTNNNSTDIIVNGFSVDVKSAHKYREIFGIEKLIWGVRKSEIRNNFFACYRYDMDVFVIIKNNFKNKKSFNIYMNANMVDSTINPKINRYFDLINRFDLFMANAEDAENIDYCI